MISQEFQTCIIKSKSHNPWMNLALEEYLLDGITENEVILYLWQNDNTVVIGRNQNPWKECRHLNLEREGGRLARRLSGGGAVYHDLGNLNFTFLMKKKHYDLPKQLNVILQAVTGLGIKAELSRRNDLMVGEKKFSGSAYYFKQDSALHHGTILINSDLPKLSRYLRVSQYEISSKAVDSVRTSVINLSEVSKELTVADVIRSLKESFVKYYPGNLKELDMEPNYYDIESLKRKYSSWEWRFGKTPMFDVSINQRFSWGDVRLDFRVKNGSIDSVLVSSDALEECLKRDIQRIFTGCIFSKDRMIERLVKVDSESNQQAAMLNDMVLWLSKTEY
jgi:lipoate-protein ligase A